MLYRMATSCISVSMYKQLFAILFIMISTGFWANAQNPVLPDSIHSYQSPLDMELFLAGNFGELRNNHFHAGLDFKTQGTVDHPVRSFADGYVCRVGINALGYGIVVYVRHPQMGLTSVYGHLNGFSDYIYKKVRARQTELEENNIQLTFGPEELPVKQGDIIAKSGAWYSYGDIRLGQGKEKVKDFLKENPDVAKEIEDKIRAMTIAKVELNAEEAGNAEPVFKEEF